MLKRRRTSGTALSLCSLEFLRKIAFSLVASDMNGYVGREVDGYGGVGFGTRNAEGERILELGDAVGMVVCNTFFKKED